MEHISKSLLVDPLVVRRLNLYKQNDITPAGQPLPYFNVSDLMDQLMKSSDYVNRCKDIEQFNQLNRWKKRGISLT
jgi:xanthine dehydrogenase molybdopterin-binding subunit B